MLTHVLVRDLAIVSHLELDCDGGMTALTGETGAGKSILIDALALVLGDKADASVIRAGCERAEIIASFDLGGCQPARAWLEEQSLDEDGECIVRRLIVREGRSRAYINGRPATGAQLRRLGDLLIDIHGQHAHQSLLRANDQKALLDAYGGHASLAAEVASSYRDWRALERELTTLEAAAQERAERLDLLRFQVGELEDIGLTVEEIEAVEREQRRLANLGRFQETLASVIQRVSESEPSLEDQLGTAAAEIGELAELDSDLAETQELLDGALIQLQEAAGNLRHYLEGLELDPAALDAVERRVALLHDMARKYRVTPERLPEVLAARRSELNELEQADQALGGLSAARDRAGQEFHRRAQALSVARAAAAHRLGDTVTAAMEQLGMAGGRFTAEIVPASPDAAPSAGGLERVEFLVSANPGQPLQPLAKVASGGELSRISLGIQVATAECGGVPTLVFDEVDVGIGGGVAEIVGRLLRRLGISRQILCVTHLPQVAAQAHHQMRVRKETREGQTFAYIDRLREQERVEEIARMLGGTAITARTRDHASEMLGWGS